MSLTPRKSEITDIAALLSEGAESPEALAGSVIKRVYELAEERVSHVVVFELTPGVYQAYGPFPTRSRAEAALPKIPMAQVANRGAYATLHGMRAALASLEAAEADKPEPRGDFKVVREDALARRRGWNGKSATRSQYV